MIEKEKETVHNGRDGDIEYQFEAKTPVAEVIAQMVPIKFPAGVSTDDGFYVVRETLRRIGIPSYSRTNKNALFQSCHILHKRGEYYICHFKQLLALDGRAADLSTGDIDRLFYIVGCLNDWGLIEIIDGVDAEAAAYVKESDDVTVAVKIIKHRDLPQWLLIPKHNIGLRK